MWQLVRRLRESGVTVILTTHYIEEAEEMADRIGVIHRGELIMVEDKVELMRKLGKKQLTLNLQEPIERLPPGLDAYDLILADDGLELLYSYDAQAGHTGIAALLAALHEAGIRFSDLNTKQSSLEEIFVSLVEEERT
jgi:ABC-2 type transport system ATP-binding protein